MPNFAIIENDTIINIVVAESIEVVKSVTSQTALLCDNENMVMGADLFNGVWRLPKPFASWTWNGEKWVAPVLPPVPVECYDWNEELKQWEQKEGALIAYKINQIS